jgi:IS605 OrfB family transposase
MAERNTPLINELLAQISQQKDFETWRQQAKLKAGIVKQLCEPLKTDPRFSGQPGRFYTSAIALVEYIYKSWFKIQQRLQRKLEGQTRWLEILKSDEELVQMSNCTLEVIRAKHRRKTEIKISRLTEQIASRIPKGRDLMGDKWLETLAIASTTAPTNSAEAKSWQDRLLTDSKSVPFPVAYESNEDLTWSKNSKGRLEVHFNGLGEHTFQIYCDQRQLKWFQRFYEDQQIKRASIDQHSSSLFTLRSGRLAWQEGTSKGDPWNIHHLTLYCTVDTRFWTAEGTEQIRQEKAADIAKTLTKMNEKGDLNEKQQAFVQRKNSTRARIKNPFPRPSQPLYQGQPHILVGVALGLDKPATAAIVDGTTGEAIAYRSIKQLLGDNYKLLNRQRQEKRSSSHQRHKAQKKAAANQFGESELGQHLDRLLATAIVKLAQTYQASSIVLPKLGDMRELVQSEIQARAEQKIPGYIEAQEKYAKQYRVNIHQWSYGRLIDTIKAQASKVGIVIEEGEQPIRGSPQEKAKAMAICAYDARSNP